MAKNKLPVLIQREIDKQKILQSLCSNDSFGLCFSLYSREERDLEEEERKWREGIQKLKEILEEYQKLNAGKRTRSSRV